MIKTFTGLTLEQARARLYAPFAPNEHEQHAFFKFWYLKEAAINDRLTEVFGIGGWDKVVTDVQHIPSGQPVLFFPKSRDGWLLNEFPQPVEFDYGKYFTMVGDKKVELTVVYDIPVVLTYGYLVTRILVNEQVVESRLHSVGGDVLVDLGKEHGAKLMNTYKSSDTDLLKRVARQAGVGLYLTQISTLSKDEKEKIGQSEANLGAWIYKTYGATNLRQAKTMLIEATKSRYETPEKLGEAIKRLEITDENILFAFKDTVIKLLAA